nr:copia protein [Tanacetum cinerariifolium]
MRWKRRFHSRRGEGSLAKRSMESKKVGANEGEVNGGGADFRVSRIVLGEILGEIIGESGGEAFGLMKEPPFLGKTPYELFKSKKPSLEYFKVFGSKYFILNTKDYLIKFDPKSTEGVFLGYLPNSKAYIILNKETMRIEESLNVKFDDSPPPKSPLLVDDDVLECEIIENQEKDLEIKENEPLNKEIINIKETKVHPIDSVIDENDVISWNKARLVAQGYNQQEGIDFDETYASVARLESIRILLAYACVHDLKLFQMDVKSAFLNSFITKDVYVAQPPGFVDFEKPNHVYKLKNALYALKQAPKAWYDRLKTFLLNHMYTMGLVDNTLFTKKKDSHIIIIQIYVYDIIFGSTCQDLCDDFSKIIHDEFEISMIDAKPIKTPMSSETKLTRDKDGESVDDTKYHGMIGSLLYLMACRTDIMFSVCLCSHFQEAPKTKHLEAGDNRFYTYDGITNTKFYGIVSTLNG